MDLPAKRESNFQLLEKSKSKKEVRFREEFLEPLINFYRNENVVASINSNSKLIEDALMKSDLANEAYPGQSQEEIKKCIAQSIPLWKYKVFPKEQFVYHFGEEATKVYLILKGEAFEMKLKEQQFLEQEVKETKLKLNTVVMFKNESVGSQTHIKGRQSPSRNSSTNFPEREKQRKSTVTGNSSGADITSISMMNLGRLSPSHSFKQQSTQSQASLANLDHFLLEETKNQSTSNNTNVNSLSQFDSYQSELTDEAGKIQLKQQEILKKFKIACIKGALKKKYETFISQLMKLSGFSQILNDDSIGNIQRKNLYFEEETLTFKFQCDKTLSAGDIIGRRTAYSNRYRNSTVIVGDKADFHVLEMSQNEYINIFLRKNSNHSSKNTGIHLLSGNTLDFSDSPVSTPMNQLRIKKEELFVSMFDCTRAQIKKFMSFFHHRVYPMNTLLWKKDSEPSMIFVILSGRIEVFDTVEDTVSNKTPQQKSISLLNSDGTSPKRLPIKRVIFETSAGNLVGEQEIVDKIHKRLYSARTVERTECFCIELSSYNMCQNIVPAIINQINEKNQARKEWISQFQSSIHHSLTQFQNQIKLKQQQQQSLSMKSSGPIISFHDSMDHINSASNTSVSLKDQKISKLRQHLFSKNNLPQSFDNSMKNNQNQTLNISVQSPNSPSHLSGETPFGSSTPQQNLPKQPQRQHFLGSASIPTSSININLFALNEDEEEGSHKYLRSPGRSQRSIPSKLSLSKNNSTSEHLLCDSSSNRNISSPNKIIQSPQKINDSRNDNPLGGGYSQQTKERKLKHSKSLHFFNSLIVDKDEEEENSPVSKKQIKLEDISKEIVTNSQTDYCNAIAETMEDLSCQVQNSHENVSKEIQQQEQSKIDRRMISSKSQQSSHGQYYLPQSTKVNSIHLQNILETSNSVNQFVDHEIHKNTSADDLSQRKNGKSNSSQQTYAHKDQDSSTFYYLQQPKSQQNSLHLNKQFRNSIVNLKLNYTNSLLKKNKLRETGPNRARSSQQSFIKTPQSQHSLSTSQDNKHSSFSTPASAEQTRLHSPSHPLNPPQKSLSVLCSPTQSPLLHLYQQQIQSQQQRNMTPIKQFYFADKLQRLLSIRKQSELSQQFIPSMMNCKQVDEEIEQENGSLNCQDIQPINILNLQQFIDKGKEQQQQQQQQSIQNSRSNLQTKPNLAFKRQKITQNSCSQTSQLDNPMDIQKTNIKSSSFSQMPLLENQKDPLSQEFVNKNYWVSLDKDKPSSTMICEILQRSQQCRFKALNVADLLTHKRKEEGSFSKNKDSQIFHEKKLLNDTALEVTPSKGIHDRQSPAYLQSSIQQNQSIQHNNVRPQGIILGSRLQSRSEKYLRPQNPEINQGNFRKCSFQAQRKCSGPPPQFLRNKNVFRIENQSISPNKLNQSELCVESTFSSSKTLLKEGLVRRFTSQFIFPNSGQVLKKN